jgi:branched-chain amino acid transport system ATP-binding protein
MSQSASTASSLWTACPLTCRGAITSVIGPNGSGKTTLMNVITGFYSLDRGSIQLAGTEFVGTTPQRIARQGIARTFQHIRLFEELSVFDNVLVAAERRQRRDASERAGAVLRLAGLASYRKSNAGVLPYGHRRRLEIARALATGPKLLILDEPAAGMNATEKIGLGGLLEEIRIRRYDFAGGT